MSIDKSKACLTLSQIEEWLNKAGVNATAQRLAICQFVLCQADHPTADDIKVWADENFPKISLATVYNTLNTLVEAGLLREYCFSHSDKKIYDNNIVDHYHLYDEAAHRLIDVSPEVVTVNHTQLKNVNIKRADLILYGSILNEEK